jgi:hypothetical protein
MGMTEFNYPQPSIDGVHCKGDCSFLEMVSGTDFYCTHLKAPLFFYDDPLAQCRESSLVISENKGLA